MNLDRVTITGADDSVDPGELLELSKEFPFVEWGILASASMMGGARFPSMSWINAFNLMAVPLDEMQISLHLCGLWVRSLLVGEIDPMLFRISKGYERIQLNFHAERRICDPEAASWRMMAALDRLRSESVYAGHLQFIFQLDGEKGNQYLEDICLNYVNVYGEPSNMVGLFDVSGGAGVLPGEWPKPIYHSEGVYDYHGYAGGLGPDNLAEQIPRIGAAAGETRIWIDMETHVRSNDRQFDLAKVRRCLEIAKPFVRVKE